jgi:hypothetical protein
MQKGSQKSFHDELEALAPRFHFRLGPPATRIAIASLSFLSGKAGLRAAEISNWTWQMMIDEPTGNVSSNIEFAR